MLTYGGRKYTKYLATRVLTKKGIRMDGRFQAVAIGTNMDITTTAMASIRRRLF